MVTYDSSADSPEISLPRFLARHVLTARRTNHKSMGLEYLGLAEQDPSRAPALEWTGASPPVPKNFPGREPVSDRGAHSLAGLPGSARLRAAKHSAEGSD
jgi:hypothetical protein